MVARAVRSAVALIAFAAMLLAGLLLVSTRAWAEIQVPEQHPGLLSIWTDSLPLHYSDMAPGEETFVRLTVQLDDSNEGDLSLQLRKSGDLATVPGGLEIEIARCDVPWTNVPTGVTEGVTPACAPGAEPLLEATPGDDYSTASPTWDLDEIEQGTREFLLVRIGIPATTPVAVTEGLSADFGFGLFAEGADAPTIPVTPAALAVTGLDVLALALIAVGAIGIGVAVRLRRTREAVA